MEGYCRAARQSPGTLISRQEALSVFLKDPLYVAQRPLL
jgi:hypothetical protein